MNPKDLAKLFVGSDVDRELADALESLSDDPTTVEITELVRRIGPVVLLRLHERDQEIERLQKRLKEAEDALDFIGSDPCSLPGDQSCSDEHNPYGDVEHYCNPCYARAQCRK